MSEREKFAEERSEVALSGGRPWLSDGRVSVRLTRDRMDEQAYRTRSAKVNGCNGLAASCAICSWSTAQVVGGGG